MSKPKLKLCPLCQLQQLSFRKDVLAKVQPWEKKTMSLDVWLKGPAPCPHCGEATGFGDEVFSANITHNLGKMAEAAGIYKHLWCPEDLEITKASQLIDPLKTGLAKMKADPENYKAYDSPNGWGLYENFVPWIEKYLAACEEYPESIIGISR